ncbi:PREDICTED: uncharacterized protein LOC109295370 isoform X1 [Gavialis gangeticus]|uniref:uncharacterized protein LOC109295370 isoform X1 n=1 Tax=Gavialis gangeticus TaxID=94835 RepID=UPI00092FC8D5|nr:PREDICTED: uncharacterized protein LOC109295370 isoform X1 [Gavialis gangeticus]
MQPTEMDPLTVPPPSSRPSLLQFFRNLFGLRKGARKSQETGAEMEEVGNIRDQEDTSNPAISSTTEFETILPAGNKLKGDPLAKESRGERLEEIVKELKEISLGGTPSSRGDQSPSMPDTSGMEMGDSSDWPMTDLSESSGGIDGSRSEEENHLAGDEGAAPAPDAADPPAPDGWRSRPSLLQLLRNLLGLRKSTREGQGTSARVKTMGNIKDQDADNPADPAAAESEPILPSGKQLTGNPLADEPQENTLEEFVEEIKEELKEISLGGTSLTRGMEMGDTPGFANIPLSREGRMAQELDGKTSGQAVKFMEEASGDTGSLRKARVSQVLLADTEGLASAAGDLPTPMEDFSAEDEREHLLKEDLHAESPKEELSPWNKLISLYKQQWKLPVPKENPLEWKKEEGSPVNLTASGFVTPVPHHISAESFGTTVICRLPRDRVEETIDHCGRAEVDLRANGPGAPEEG